MIIPALICVVVFTSYVSKGEPKEKKVAGEMYKVSEEWWQPILRKFNLKLSAYNNFDNVFVMGMKGNSINNGICTLKAATVLIKGETALIKGERYALLEADSVYYNIEKRIFEFMPDAKKAYAFDADLNEILAVHGSIVRIELRDGIGAVVISRSSRTQ